MLGSDDIVTLYSITGTVIAKFKLEQISPFKIEDYERSVSSIWWGGASLDRNEEWLNFYFKTEKGKSELRRFNLQELKFEEGMELKEE